MMQWPSTVKQFNTVPELNRSCAELLVQEAAEAIALRGFFSLVLAGGNTPRGLYTLLAEPQISASLDWTKIFIFWSDERCVPADHPESNFSMANETFLAQTAIPEENIFRMPGELPGEQGAKCYEDMLTGWRLKMADITNNSPRFPAFDLVLLGVGLDGHTASLFPDSTALQEKNQLVCAVPVSISKPAVCRLTLTLPVLNQARNVWFLVSGSAKKEITERVFSENSGGVILPAARVKPVGRLRWFVCFA